MPPIFSEAMERNGAIKLKTGRLLPRSNKSNRFHCEFVNEQYFLSAPKANSPPVKTAGIQSGLTGDDACVAMVNTSGHRDRDIGSNGNQFALRARFHPFRRDSTNAEPEFPTKSNDYAVHSKSSKKYF